MKSADVKDSTAMKTMKIGKSLYAIFICALSLLWSGSSMAGFTATVSQTTLSELDIISLTLRSDDPSVRFEPDLNPLYEDFEVLNTSRSTRQSMTIVNGQRTVEATIDWNISIKPKRAGNLTIPSIKLGSASSNPINLRVLPASGSSIKRTNEKVFLESSVDKSETFVQAGIIYTISLFYSESLAGDFPPAPSINDAVIEIIENEKRFKRVINGMEYHVLQKRYAIFPQKSGSLTIPRATFSGYINAGGFGLFSDRRPVSVASDSHNINVQPRPSSWPRGAAWLPAEDLAIGESWSSDPPVFRVGEPVNRILTISATGLPASILPATPDLTIPGVKIYKDPPETTETATSQGIVSLRAEVIGLVPVTPGRIELPEIRIPWWNTKTNRMEEAVIKKQTYQVLQAEDSFDTQHSAITTSANSGQPETSSLTPEQGRNFFSIDNFWFYATVVLALAALSMRVRLTGLPAKFSSASGSPFKQETADAGNESRLYKNFVMACHKASPHDMRAALYLWAKQVHPEISSLADFAGRLKDDADRQELLNRLNRLETSLYGSSKSDFTAQDANALLSIMAGIRKNLAQRKDTSQDLPPLNP